MKLKGINPIEKNVEKIVLGLVFVVLLAALAMQFLVKPNQVDVGGGRTVAPENIYNELANEASLLKGKIQDRDPSLPEVKPTDLLERYQTALTTSATGVGQIAPLVEGVDVLGGVQVADGGIAPGGPVMAPRVPAPSAPIASSQWGTLDPYTVESNEALARIAPAQQPYDVPAVSVEAVFSGVELARLLAGADEGRRPIPGPLRRQVEIVRVELERQRLDPQTGAWADANAGTPLPTAYDPALMIADQVDLSTLLGIAGDARRNRRQLVQPPFAPLIAGPVWSPPAQAIAAMGAMSDINSLPRQRFELAKAERTLADLEDRKRGAATRPAGTQTTVSDDPRRGGAGARNTGSTSTSSRPSRDSTQSLDRRIADARDEVNKYRDRVRELDDERQQAQRTDREALDRPLFDQDALRLWTHDFGVEPGATYRYRIRAVVNNPLFKKGAQLDPADPEQQSLTREPLVFGAWSGWTTPVTVGADTYYFVTNASTEGQVGVTGPSASVEVFHMYYGHYRADTTRMEPGDAIDVAVDLPAGFVTFDTAAVDAQGMRRFIERKPPADEAPPEGITRLATDRDVALPTYLLEVAPLPITREAALGAAARQVIQAVFRDPDGSLSVHRPSDAQTDAQLQMARESAQAGGILDLRVPDAVDDLSRLQGPRGPRGPRPSVPEKDGP